MILPPNLDRHVNMRQFASVQPWRAPDKNSLTPEEKAGAVQRMAKVSITEMEQVRRRIARRKIRYLKAMYRNERLS